MIEPSQSLKRVASWILKNKTTGKVICETYNPLHVLILNVEKYKAVTILKHLQSLNNEDSDD